MTSHLVVECPHCYTRVLPKANNICPACRMDMTDTPDIDPQVAALVVRESDVLPPYCYMCNSYTERYVKIVGDKGTLLDQSLGAVVSLLIPTRKIEQDTSNVFVSLPQCEACAAQEEPAPLHVDYDTQSMVFVVNIGFKERVHPARIEKAHPDNDETIDEESSEL